VTSVDVDIVAIVIVREGRLPAGADEAVTEANGAVVLLGSGAAEAAELLTGASRVWVAPTSPAPGPMAARLAPELAGVQLVILPASPDGRDLAPRLAAVLARPLLAGSVRAALVDRRVQADLLRVDGRVVVPVGTSGAAVATLWPGARPARPAAGPATVHRLELAATPEGAGSVAPIDMVEPDPATMDLGEATRVIGGGAGLVPEGSSDEEARALFDLLSAVAAALGASAGATRVVTDAGWMGYDRQIGTTGVTLDPELYVALGVSGATQHTGGLGDPRHVVSVNVDASCPMTGLADLGLVSDAPALLMELADRLGVDLPEPLKTRSVQQ
jgi:electron transfer flavoprotein alpha subunit